MGLAGFRAAQHRPGAVLLKPAKRSAATGASLPRHGRHADAVTSLRMT